MKRNSKTLGALASGAFLACGMLVQPAHATIISSGTATLVDVIDDPIGSPEDLTVTYQVNQTGSLYTYTYMVNNPTGDVQLPGSASPGSPEVVDAFSVTFDTTVPGAFIAQFGGVSEQNNGVNGLFWSFNAVSAGSSTGILSFTSDDPPTMGNANAQDANPPSPWSSAPFGQQVPIPQTATVPDGAATAGLLGGVLMLLPFGVKRRNR